MREAELVQRLESEFTYVMPTMAETVGAEVIRIVTIAKDESELGTLVQRHYDDIMAHADLYRDNTLLIRRIGQITKQLSGDMGSQEEIETTYHINTRLFLVKDKDKYNKVRNELIKEELESESYRLKSKYKELI